MLGLNPVWWSDAGRREERGGKSQHYFLCIIYWPQIHVGYNFCQIRFSGLDIKQVGNDLQTDRHTYNLLECVIKAMISKY